MKLEIRDNSIYLDSTLLKGVIDYKLEESVSSDAQFTVTLLVDSAKVTPPEIGDEKQPEEISPLKSLSEHVADLSKVLGGGRKYYGVTVETPNPNVVDQIRQIVREELADHEERLIKLNRDEIAKETISRIRSNISLTPGDIL